MCFKIITNNHRREGYDSDKDTDENFLLTNFQKDLETLLANGKF
jgi:hypothetical protein